MPKRPSVTIEPIMGYAPIPDADIARLNELYHELGGKSDVVTRETIQAATAGGSVIVVARNAASEIVGMGTLAVCRTISGPEGHVEHVSVHPSARRQGIASEIVRRLIEYARHRKLKRADLTSNPSRPGSYALYTGLGFEVRETRNYRHKLGR